MIAPPRFSLRWGYARAYTPLSLDMYTLGAVGQDDFEDVKVPEAARAHALAQLQQKKSS